MAESSPDSCFKGGKFSAPGFRFHPTDEELVMYYLKRKICRKRLRVNVIGVVDVYKMDPQELPGQSMLKTGDRQWFYFTPRSRKYPNAARSSRGTETGYWKATGKDRVIEYNSRSVGLKKTLVFYRGRAPNGERTDWVMHEYTMDEDELGRCKYPQDYYALYKLFKKSGAGPKNGEQYGAPFQEEEWVDDDNEDENTVAVPDQPVVRYEDERRLFNPVSLQLEDIDVLLNGIPDAPGVPPRCIPQVHSEEELQSTLVNDSARDFVPNSQPYNRPSSFDSLETTEATSVPLVFEKEDFIEMDDLLIPELGASSTEKAAQVSNHGEFGDFNDFDQLFHDVSMSLDMELIDQGTSTNLTSVSSFANDTSNQRQQFLYQQLEDQTPENQLNNIMDPSTTLNQFTDEIWFQDDQAVLFDEQQAFSGSFAPPSSGVMPDSTNPTMSVHAQDQERQNGGGTTSQFSSALWALMDSIPSTPASACEGPLNRTFVRMSSFSRIRFKANGTPVTSTIAKKGIRNRGFLLLSIVGALCAIFWVFIATVRVSGRTVFS
ncbi:PREDICTED: NAC domain-containing protein 17 isoform X2 [Camelina sativa]|uniref:NAC domain-containing protein 17 isoform X1 n=1 Tax=Camelina sativa TaxID=90675 RepID=A0ABM1QY52_CAMSA|nr:PREDICTED: NAC domain-containing protein 17 isoform X1 [Camelina sativa]XP_019091691.1 PREDICTED: NAC domain-containing protein 17 isoform X2 [Camelina sativa]